MIQSQFDMLLREVFAESGDNYIVIPEEMQQPHVFSKKFKKKMQKLIRHKRSIFFQSVRLPVEKAAVVMVAAFLTISVLALGNYTAHNRYPGFFTSDHEQYTLVRCEPDEDAPLRIETVYDITGLPEGFDLTRYEIVDPTGLMRNISFEDKEKHIYVDFQQRTKYQYKVQDNTEGFPMHRALVNGNNGYFIEMFEVSRCIRWNDDDYMFKISIAFDDRYYTREEERELVKPILENMKIVQVALDGVLYDENEQDERGYPLVKQDDMLFDVEAQGLPLMKDVEFPQKRYALSRNAQKIVYDGIEVVEIVE